FIDVLLTYDCAGKKGSVIDATLAIRNDLIKLKPALDNFLRTKNDNTFNRTYIKAVCSIIKGIDFPPNVRLSKGLEELLAAYKRLKETRKDIDSLDIGEDYVTEQAAHILFRLLGIFKEINKRFSKEKSKKESLDYNDIELMTYDLISKNPNISEYYRKKYSYILVDEFQDTNKYQRDVLFEISKKLFLVGDAKQSIYRFRNADVRVFVDTQNKIASLSQEKLSNNYRSRKNIIDTVNKGFDLLFDKWVTEKESFDPEYMKMEMGRIYDDDGIVKFINVGNPDKRSADIELEALTTSKLIKSGISNGRSPEDYAVLFKTKAEISVFEKFFIKEQIPYVVWGETDKEQVIKKLLGLFSFIANPYNDLSLFETVKLPRFFISDEALYRLRQDNEYLWTAISTYDLDKNIDSLVEEDIASIRVLIQFFNRSEELVSKGGNFTEYVADILYCSEFIHSIKVFTPGLESGLEELILKVAQDVENDGGGVLKFIEFLSISKSDKNDAEVSGAVRLMTVHASKGLDFPVVILPCLHKKLREESLFSISQDGEVSLVLRDILGHNRKATPRHASIKDSERKAELAESRRVFYVASTRAKEELYFIGNFKGALNKKENTGNRWLDWIARMFEEDIKEPEIKDEDKKIRSKVLREIIKINISKPLYIHEHINVPRRYSVSMIRDFAFSPDLMLNRILKDEVQENSDGSRRIGTILHALLEAYGNKESFDELLNGYPENIVKTIKEIFNSFVGSELGKKVFSANKFINEHSFMTKIASNIVVGRIDRINIYENEVWVLDYKTGLDEKMMDSYKAQMACYLSYAKAMYPNHKVHGSIIDITSNTETIYNYEELSDWICNLVGDLNLFIEQ
ncbi:MAG: 3'-5' exonuclease, partial [bacterium]